MNRVIITGVTGFLGGALAKKLLENDIEVFGVDISTPKFKEFEEYKNFHKVVADFEKYKFLPDIISSLSFDVFYHFAWAGGFTEALKDYKLQMNNAAYAADALVAAKKLNCKKFVYAGTYNEFEIQTFLNSESFQPRFTCIYATAKTAADLICKTLAYNMNIAYNIAFIPMPYGERNFSRQLANVVINELCKGRAPKLVEGNNLYDLVYVEDIAEAFIAIGARGKDQKGYYVGHRKLKSFRNWMIEIRDILSPGTELRFGEYKDTQTIDYSLIDLDALYQDTGFECKADFRESICKTAKWVKSLNWE